MCGHKRRYESREAALTGLIRLIRVRDVAGLMRCYRCEFCRGYHFGHLGNPRRVHFGPTSRLAA